MLQQRQSKPNQQRINLGILKTLVKEPTCKSGKLMPDGGNFSDLLEERLSMREVKLLELRMITLLFRRMMDPSISFGQSFMLIKPKTTSQENSTQTLVFMFKDHSMWSLN